jgi:hypothetical protein
MYASQPAKHFKLSEQGAFELFGFFCAWFLARI